MQRIAHGLQDAKTRGPCNSTSGYKLIFDRHKNVWSYLSLVFVHDLVAGVEGGTGRLAAPDAVHDAEIGEADDEQREEVLDDDQVQAVHLRQETSGVTHRQENRRQKLVTR